MCRTLQRRPVSALSLVECNGDVNITLDDSTAVNFSIGTRNACQIY